MRINSLTDEVKLDPGDFEFKKPISPFITFKVIENLSYILLLKIKENIIYIS